MGKKRAVTREDVFSDWWTVNVLGANAGAEIRGIGISDSGVRSVLRR
tara:strand:+ start:1475 stop:1615 length:141 start_codon:yes stop_codon:yes gene_type:complete